jgi:hypothetical protein
MSAHPPSSIRPSCGDLELWQLWVLSGGGKEGGQKPFYNFLFLFSIYKTFLKKRRVNFDWPTRDDRGDMMDM